MTLAPLTLLGLALCAAAGRGRGLAVRAAPARRPVRAPAVPRPGARPREARGPGREGRLSRRPAPALCPDPVRQPGLDPGHRRARRGRAGRRRPLRRRRPQPPDRRPRPRRRRRRRPRPPAGPRERLWRLPLDVAMVDKDVTRKVTLAPWCSAWARAAGRSATRRPATSRGPSRSAAGQIAASRPRAGRRRRQRPLTDPQDRLWIDLNGDGRFDPAAEQFLFATVLQPRRGAVRRPLRRAGQPAGLEPLVGVGTLRLALGREPDGAPGGSSSSCTPRLWPRRLGLRPLRHRAGVPCRSASTGWGP